MRKTLSSSLAALVVLSAALLCGTASKADEPDDKLHQKCIYPVVMVAPEGKESCGSGVIVRCDKVKDGLYKNVFVTCAHVALAAPEDYEVKVYKYKDWSDIESTERIPCEFTFHDPDVDLSVGVFLTTRPMPVAEIDFDTKLYIGSKILRIGCGLGGDPRLDDGKVTQPRVKVKGLGEVMRTNVHTLPGDSGAPLYHKYRVVGIAQAIRRAGFQVIPNYSFYIPISRLKDLDAKHCHSLRYAWGEAQVPGMPFHRLKLREMEVTGEQPILKRK